MISLSRYYIKKTIRCFSSQVKNIFDRGLKRRQREWSVKAPDSKYYDYLREESAERLVDRLDDISRSFPLALDIGCHRGHILSSLSKRKIEESGKCGDIENLVQCDMSLKAIQENKAIHFSTKNNSGIEPFHLVCDEEFLPFKPNTFDLVMSSMNLHWVNNLPSTLLRIKEILKPDGAFLGTILGGSTLHELKHCFFLSEQERRGGLSPHTSPFIGASDLAGLMQEAGFSLPTIDLETITIGYPDAITLMEHLQHMGESHAAFNRHFNVGKDTFLATASLYQEIYGKKDENGDFFIPATFQLLHVIGWSPHDSQPKPCRRGSATHSLKSVL